MKKTISALLAGLLMMGTAMAAGSETLKFTTKHEFPNQPTGFPMWNVEKDSRPTDITLEENENALIVRFGSQNPGEMEYYISIYDCDEEKYLTSNQIPGCPEKMIGPIDEGEFRFTGLRCGGTYQIRIATAINSEILEASVYGTTVEPVSETTYAISNFLPTGTSSEKDLGTGLALDAGSGISRGDMSALIRNLLPPVEKEVQAINFAEYPFSDVTPEMPNKKAIDELCALRVINGVGGGMFLPDAAVTNGAAVKMIVCALGYGGYAESLGGWPEGYIACGQQLGIYDGTAPEDAAVWACVSQMLAKAYTVPHLCVSEYSANGNAVFYQNENITYEKMN